MYRISYSLYLYLNLYIIYTITELSDSVHCTYIHTYIHTYIRTYTHTYIHTYVHCAYNVRRRSYISKYIVGKYPVK